MSKKIIISENEKNRIKSLYNLNEQEFNPLDVVLKTAMKKLEDLRSGKISPDSEEGDTESEDKTEDKSNSYKSSGNGDFYDITKKVIENFEGGYWNPECAGYPGSKHPRKTGMYSRSGETMFGLDREAGKIEDISSDGKKFFQLIDDQKEEMGMDNFCKKWTWNYRGGEIKSQLLDLAVKTMKSLFDKNSKNYLSEKARNIVNNSNPLLLHFSYATWNGPGFFKDFAKSINKAVDEGKSEKDLVKIAKADRDRRLGGGAWAKANEKVKSLIDKEASGIV
jgi:hypothetical protein